MTASIAARTRKAAESAGPYAEVEVATRGDAIVYKLRCTKCVVREQGRVRWSSYRKGEDNGFIAAIDRWVLHLVGKHPGAEAPCLEYLDEAQERAIQRRTAREAARKAEEHK